MNWNFIKTNWFYLALGLLLVLYTIRKFPSLNPFDATNKNAQPEKVTEGKGARKGGAALLGFVPETPKERPPEMDDVDASKAEAFLKRFANVALSEHKKFGTPASVILACAYVNSQAGQRETATAANNFFALPCSQGWEGETVQMGGKCVRKYESAWASFRDFSIYLSSQEWFGSLKKSAGKDGRKWAEKLGSEGVANAKVMQKVMEAYRLHELDEQ
ncbi:MAG: glucosaminidase domain-containing protein [Phycisphaerae bacterium]|nr:glucosaminidase domain-containing protein [Saprospiraceae bacterium]